MPPHAAGEDHDAVVVGDRNGAFDVGGIWYRMDTPARPKTVAGARVVDETLAMKRLIERCRATRASGGLEKRMGIRASALEARPLSGCQSGGLVAKEQSGVMSVEVV